MVYRVPFIFFENQAQGIKPKALHKLVSEKNSKSIVEVEV